MNSLNIADIIERLCESVHEFDECERFDRSIMNDRFEIVKSTTLDQLFQKLSNFYAKTKKSEKSWTMIEKSIKLSICVTLGHSFQKKIFKQVTNILE